MNKPLMSDVEEHLSSAIDILEDCILLLVLLAWKKKCLSFKKEVKGTITEHEKR